MEQPPTIQPTRPDVERQAPRHGIATVAWFSWGLIGSILGGVAGGYAGWLHIADSNDDLAGLLLLLTIPIGWLIGGIISVLLAWIAEHRNRSAKANWSRTFLAFFGFLSPLMVLLFAIFVPQVIMGG